MADITDGLGRVSSGGADFESLKKGLESVVRKTVDFVEKSRERGSAEYKKLSEALEKLDSSLKDSVKETEEFVSKIKEVAKQIADKKERGGQRSEDKLERIAQKQLKMLEQMLKMHANSSGSLKVAGPTGASRRSKTYGPKGKDNVPAFLQEGEVVVSKKNAEKGAFVSPTKALAMRRGGVVRRGGGPQYLAGGTGPISIPTRLTALFAGVSAEEMEQVVRFRVDPKAFKGEALEAAKTLEEQVDNRLKMAGSYAQSISNALTGGQDIFVTMFSGVVEDATKLRREMREIAFQTQGITGDMRDMQAAFADIGKNVVAETGQSITAMRDALIKNTRKGMGKGGMDAMKSTLKSGLYMSTMIGSEAQQTADLFADWHRQLKLSANQMDVMARNMKSVALSTGVSGDELLEAMKSSQGILKNMRNQGNLTASSTETIVAMMAEAKKTGDEGYAEELLTTMSSFKNLMGAGEENKRFLFGIAANINQKRGNDSASMDMLSGTFMNKRENVKAMQGELLELLKRYEPSIKNIDDIDKLSDEQRGYLNRILSTQNTSAEQIRSLYKQTEVGSTGLEGRIAKQQAIIDKRYSTEEERMLAMKKMNEDYSNGALNYLSAIREKSSDMPLPEIFDEMAKGGSKFANLNEDFLALAGAMDAGMKRKFGISGTADQQKAQMQGLSGQQKMQLAAAVAADSLKKAAKQQGKSAKDFSSAAMNITDNDSFNKFNEEIQSEFKKMGIDEATKVDPMTELNQTMLKLNETIRGFLSPLIGGFIDLIGANGLLIVSIGLLSANIYAVYAKGILKFLNLFKRGGGKGGAKAAGMLEGFFKGAEKGFSAFYKGFTRGFSQARKAGDGFFKSLFGAFKRGLSGAIKSNRYTRTLAPKAAAVGSKVWTSAQKAQGILWQSVDKFFKGMRKGFSAFFNGFTRGFSQARQAGNGFFRSFFSAFKRGFSGATKSLGHSFSKTISLMGKGKNLLRKGVVGMMTKLPSMVLGGFGKVLTKLRSSLEAIKTSSPLAYRFGKSLLNLSKTFTSFREFGKIIPRFAMATSTGFDIFKAAFKPGAIKGMFTAAKRFMTGGFKAVKGALGKAGPLAIIMAVVDGVIGAVTGFMNTGKNFEGVMRAMGKSTKDMTWGMYASSTVAGSLVGILDGLTFGLLSMTGVAEVLNQALSLLLYTVFSVVEGIVNGLVGAFQMVWSAIKYVGKQFEGIANSFLEIFNSIAGLFGAEAGNWSEAFAMIYPWLKRIGTVIGVIVGGPLMATLWAVVKGISLMLVPVQMLIAAFAAVFKVVRGFIDFFFDIFKVGLWQATKNLGSVFIQAIYGIFRPIVDFIWSLGQDIMAPFKWLYNILVGNSIIPDLCTAIVGFFGKMAMKAIKFVASIPGKVLGGLYSVFVKGPVSLLKKGAGLVSNIAKKAFGFGKDVAKSPAAQKVMKKFMENTFLKGPVRFLRRSAGTISNMVKRTFGFGKDMAKNPAAQKFMKKFMETSFLKSPVSILKKGAGVISNLAKKSFGFAKDVAKNIGKNPVIRKAMDKLISKIPAGTGKWLQRAFVKRPVEMFGKMFKFLNTKVLRSGLGIVSERFGSFFKLFRGNLSGLTKFFGESWYSFLNTASGGTFGKIVNAVKNSKIAQLVDDFLIKPIANGLGWLGGKAGEVFNWFKSKAGAVVEWGKNLYKGAKEFLGKGASAAAGADDVAKVAGKAAEGVAKAGADDMAKVAASGLDDAAKVATKATEAALKAGGVADDAIKGATKAAGGLDDVLKAAPGVLGKGGSKVMGAIAKKAPIIGPLIDFGVRTWSGQSVGKAATGTATGVGGGILGGAAGAGIGSLIGGGLGGLIGSIIPGAGTVAGAALGSSIGAWLVGGAGAIAGGVGAGMASDAVYDSVMGPAEAAAQASLASVESKSTNVATPVGQHAIPVARPEEVSDVQPVHLRDISQTMLRDRAGTQAGNKQLHSDELTKIQEASDEQVYELQQIREGIETLVGYMRPTGSAVGTSEIEPGSTKDPRRPMHAALYGKRKYSQPGGLASRALVNDGEV